MERNELAERIIQHGVHKEIATRKPYTSYELDTRLMQKSLYRLFAYETPSHADQSIKQAADKVIHETHRSNTRTTL